MWLQQLSKHDIAEEILKCVLSDSDVPDTFAGNLPLVMETLLWRPSVSHTNLVDIWYTSNRVIYGISF